LKEKNLKTRHKLRKLKAKMSNLKEFSQEHKSAVIAGVILVLSLIASITIYFFAKPDYDSLQKSLDNGSYADAIRTGEAALARDKNNLDIIHFLAGAYLSEAQVTGDVKWNNKSIGFLLTNLKTYPNDPDLLRLTGYYYFMMGLNDQAEKYYQESANANPKSPLVWSALGELYEKEVNYSKANSLYNKALGIDPNDPIANLGVVRSLFRKNRKDEARAKANALLVEAKDQIIKANINEILGLDAMLDKDYATAEKYFVSALSINQNLPASLATLAYAIYQDSIKMDPKMRTTNLLQAESLAEKSVAIKANYSYGYAVLARIEALKGDVAKTNEYKSMVNKILKYDNFTDALTKESIKKAFATTTPVSNFKVLSVKRIVTPPKDATSTGFMITTKK
jgi:tetratricopeptide (TPR) repeat protein